MCRKVGNGWIEYRQPIDLLEWPSNIELRVCWYQNKNGPMWTYALTYHLMLEETIIALASMTYVVELNLYELFNG